MSLHIALPDTQLTHQRQWKYDFLRSQRFDEWMEMMDAEIVNYRSITRSAK
jgi:hypothetical protein